MKWVYLFFSSHVMCFTVHQLEREGATVFSATWLENNIVLDKMEPLLIAPCKRYTYETLYSGKALLLTAYISVFPIVNALQDWWTTGNGWPRCQDGASVSPVLIQPERRVPQAEREGSQTCPGVPGCGMRGPDTSGSPPCLPSVEAAW